MRIISISEHVFRELTFEKYPHKIKLLTLAANIVAIVVITAAGIGAVAGPKIPSAGPATLANNLAATPSLLLEE